MTNSSIPPAGVKGDAKPASETVMRVYDGLPKPIRRAIADHPFDVSVGMVEEIFRASNVTPYRMAAHIERSGCELVDAAYRERGLI